MGLLYEKEARASGSSTLPDIKNASASRARIALDGSSEGVESWDDDEEFGKETEAGVLDELDADTFDD